MNRRDFLKGAVAGSACLGFGNAAFAAGKQPDRVKQMAAMWQEFAERTKVLPWPRTKKYGFTDKKSEKGR